jgi:hypothetical protein
MLYRAVLVCGSLLVACTEPAPKADPAPQPGPPAKVEPVKEEAPPPQVEVKVETPPVKTEPEVTLDSKVGVAACDDYVARYRACLDEKVAEGEKRSHTTALLNQLKTWSAAKDDPKLAPALADECTAAAEAARAATRVLGCVWREGDTPEPEQPKGGKDRAESQPRRTHPDLGPLD